MVHTVMMHMDTLHCTHMHTDSTTHVHTLHTSTDTITRMILITHMDTYSGTNALNACTHTYIYTYIHTYRTNEYDIL